MIKATKGKTTRRKQNTKEEKEMMDKIRTNPIIAAIFSFIFTWAGFPAAAFIAGSLRGISFAEAAGRPYTLAIFAAGSVIAAVTMYHRTRESMI